MSPKAGRKLRRGARLWTVAVATFKSETYRFLRLERPTDEEIAQATMFPAGFVHLPRGVEAEWVKQLGAEQLVTIKTKRGFQKLEWQKLRERNEALDCRVYARAAAWIAGADRWTEEKWRDLEDQVGPRPRRIMADIAPMMMPDASLAAGMLARAPSAIGGKRRSDWLAGATKDGFEVSWTEPSSRRCDAPLPRARCASAMKVSTVEYGSADDLLEAHPHHRARDGGDIGWLAAGREICRVLARRPLMIEATWLDRAIGTVAPRAAVAPRLGATEFRCPDARL